MSDPPAPVGSQLRAAPPDQLPEVAADHLRENFAADQIEILLGDLSLSNLWPVLDPAAPTGGQLVQRCFASQRPIVDTAPAGRRRYLLPLSVWGDRLGVLEIVTNPGGCPRLPGPGLNSTAAEDGSDLAGPALVEQLRGVADELAFALRAAEKSTDRYRRVQRRERLTMAAELQWELLPGRSLSDDRFLLAAALEPAYAMYGDHYDWALDAGLLTVTVLNGHGDGIEAALLTTVAVNAMRNARRAGAGIVEQAELASDAVYSRYGGIAHLATLLLEINLADGRVAAVDAGSPRAVIARDGEIRPVQLEQQLPLGMFGDSRYEIQQFPLELGDRLLVVSDGVHDATPSGRPAYGQSALLTDLRRTRLQPPSEAVNAVMRGLSTYHAGMDPEDDAVIVCLDRLR